MMHVRNEEERAEKEKMAEMRERIESLKGYRERERSIWEKMADDERNARHR